MKTKAKTKAKPKRTLNNYYFDFDFSDHPAALTELRYLTMAAERKRTLALLNGWRDWNKENAERAQLTKAESDKWDDIISRAKAAGPLPPIFSEACKFWDAYQDAKA